jgi:predicted ester cyclase
MDEVLLEKEVSTMQKKMEDYFKTHDVKYVAEDAVFTHMNTGERYEGREAISQMLHYVYHVAFDAHAQTRSMVVTEDKAAIEGNFIGKHIGEFAGVQPTGKDVNVPLCVTYELKNGFIQEARIYMLVDVIMKQLTT